MSLVYTAGRVFLPKLRTESGRVAQTEEVEATGEREGRRNKMSDLLIKSFGSFSSSSLRSSDGKSTRTW